MTNLKLPLLLSTLLLIMLPLSMLPGYSLEFPIASDRGAPSRTESGGTRGDRCQLPVSNRISALVPRNNISTFTGPQASFWLRVPAELSQKRAEIFVQNPETFEIIYQKQFVLADLETGIAKIDLPDTNAQGTPLLAVEQDYFWEFAVICDLGDRTRDHIVQGFVQRLETTENFDREMANLTAQQQAEKYAEAGIWQETLALTSQMRASEPALWSQLLTSVGLDFLVNEPLVDQAALDCCQSSEPN